MSLTSAILDGQTRRAVLVGICDYRPPANVLNEPLPRRWRNLKGAVNDVAAMKGVLQGRYGFQEENLLVLTDKKATRKRILEGIERQLINAAEAGDICVFYFAGHGSQVKNNRSQEPDGMDETLVPADWYAHGDIRDKELKVLFNRILDKGASLTVIVDACHSGSISRGIPSPVEYRSLPPGSVAVSDPRDITDPVERGATVFSAAQDFELAREKKFERDRYHGVFSWALTRTLLNAPIDIPARDIMTRVYALMQSEGCNLKSPSTPNLERRGPNRRKPLFGVPEKTRRTIAATALHVHHHLITLQGGIATGINMGCQLEKITQNKEINPFVVEVFRLWGLDRCQAKVIKGQAQTIKPGDFFQIHRWAAPPETRMNVWMPHCPLDSSTLLQTAQRIRSAIRDSASVQWVEDPIKTNPTHIMSWHVNQWKISSPDGTIVQLGDNPDHRHILNVLQALHAPGSTLPRLFLQLPLDSNTHKQINSRLDYFNETLEFTSTNHNAHYILTGRVHGKHIQYSWILPNQTAAPNHHSVLPFRTSWSSPIAYETICSDLLRLVKIRAWHQLSSPPDNGPFPYVMALKNIDTNQIVVNRTLKAGEKFIPVLKRKNNISGQKISSRYIYIFAIDNQGTGTLLFPSKKRMNSENHIELKDGPTKEIIELGLESSFRVKPPFGIDTFFLLTTKQAISNPGVLDFSGVRRDYQVPEYYSPLERLLSGLGSGVRKRVEATPISWSIQRRQWQTIGTPQSSH